MKTHTLNEAQKAAVFSDHPKILCLSGPGSGKTRTIIERIDHLTNAGIAASSMVVLTFTTNAAREIQERLGAAKLGYAGTLHSFLLGLIQKHWELLGYPSAKLAVLDEEQAKEITERVCKELNYRGTKADMNAALQRDRMDVLKSSPKLADLVAARIATVLSENGLLTFDRILIEGLRLIKSGVPMPYAYLMVDEYQDTSDMDAAIYDALPIENKCYVGDPDQQCYTFRGANIKNIMALVDSPDVLTLILEENYRSDRLICSAANRLIGHNTGRVEKYTRAVSTDAGEVTVQAFANPSAEMFWALGILRECVAMGDSAAVLLRTNHLVDEWTTFLEGNGLPIAKRARTNKPADWPLAKVCVGLLNDPENDWLAYRYLVAKHGEGPANAYRLNANASCASLNSLTLKLPHGTPLTLYSQSLARLGVSPESVTLVETAIKEQAPTGGTELMASLAEKEHSESEIGHGIHVGTIHSYKGKEAAVILAPAFEQEIIPGNKTGEAAEEERRLAYVLFTRAKHRLLISHCRERKPQFGSWKPVPATPSEFLRESGLL